MKRVSFILIGTLIFISSFAQESESFKDRLFTGGQVGLTLGSYTNVMISPVLGARLNDKVYAGLGIEYQYTKDKTISPSRTYNQYGGRLFAQYNVLPSIFGHAEFAGLSMERYNYLLQKERNFVPFLFVGGGYRQYLSRRSFVTFRVLFDILQDENSPYKAWDPVFSVGFGIGI
ncbi:hypothetical protein [Carboxylicivirga caseinilyticus]|uniref:hypothetical protein n=1 Tax=Carboxylicivirga caseinilyticus TaxID=3417572 RepID=UPI003D334100|nr:hypothetical protein [Marinilabiliaceae bacterium A049]